MDQLGPAKQVLDLARDAGIMIATAESCTGGLIFAALTEPAGSSAVMDRGFVTYSNDAKTQALGVPADIIDEHGAVSPAVARAMAEGALSRANAKIAISVTGVAGPGASAAKPEGMVCFALARDGSAAHTETKQFGPIGRSNVRAATVSHALAMLHHALVNLPKK